MFQDDTALCSRQVFVVDYLVEYDVAPDTSFFRHSVVLFRLRESVAQSGPWPWFIPVDRSMCWKALKISTEMKNIVMKSKRLIESGNTLHS